MESFKDSRNLDIELMKNRKRCKYCGHSISFYAFEPDKKLCSHCGRYNYRDEKSEFKDLFTKKRREKEKCKE